jgi:eukaryotic-like serine/threonine-protein kinase
VPAIGTGAAGVSAEACAYAAASAILQHVLLGGSRLREVRFVLFTEEILQIFVDELAGVLVGDQPNHEAPSGSASDPSLEETLHLDAILTDPTLE